VCRTAAGSAVDWKPFEHLLERQLEEERRRRPKRQRRDESLAERLSRTGLTPRQYLAGCNAHLLDDPLPATHCIYCDINSLYATAGNHPNMHAAACAEIERERVRKSRRFGPRDATRGAPPAKPAGGGLPRSGGPLRHRLGAVGPGAAVGAGRRKKMAAAGGR
jgi:hypothetical protein